MKTKTRLFLMSLIVIFGVFQSCSVLEKGSNYNTDEYFTAEVSSESSNLSFAKETALFNAKKKLAEKIYYSKNSKRKGKTKAFEQSLRKIRIVKEKCFVLENGNYECVISVATPKNLY